MLYAKAPSLLVTMIFMLGGLVGYFFLGESGTTAAIQTALAAVMALWKVLQVHAENDADFWADRENLRSSFDRLFWG